MAFVKSVVNNIEEVRIGGELVGLEIKGRINDDLPLDKKFSINIFKTLDSPFDDAEFEPSPADVFISAWEAAANEQAKVALLQPFLAPRIAKRHKAMMKEYAEREIKTSFSPGVGLEFRPSDLTVDPSDPPGPPNPPTP